MSWYDNLSPTEKEHIDAMDREEAELRERDYWSSGLYGVIEYQGDDDEDEEDPEWDDKPRWVVYPDESEGNGGTIYEPNV